jgi:acetolactate synthase-1/2/3 large subunit
MEVGMPDFVKLAEAYGVKGMLIENRDELKDAIAEILAHDGPVLADIRVNRNENCYPMVAPGKSNAQMIGLPERNKIEVTELVYCSSCGAKNIASNKFCPDCGTKL